MLRSGKQRNMNWKAKIKETEMVRIKHLTALLNTLPEKPPILDITDYTAPNIQINSNQDQTVPPGPSSSRSQQGFHSKQGINDQPGSTGQNQSHVVHPQWTPEQIKKWTIFHENIINYQKRALIMKQIKNISLGCEPPQENKIFRRYSMHPSQFLTCDIEDLKKYHHSLGQSVKKNPCKMADLQLQILLKEIIQKRMKNEENESKGQHDMASQNIGMSGPTFAPTFTKSMSPFANEQLFVQTNYPTGESGTYSPTEAARDHSFIDEELQEHDGSESPTTGQKRLSAFQRLGPVSQAKKPKLTINLLFSKEQNVREVLNENTEVVKKPEEHVPVHKRQDILTSIDDTVIRYLPDWPWKGTVGIKRTAMHRSSKSSMMMEQEAMIEGYETNNTFIKIQVRDYPAHYKKEDVLDLLLDQVKGKSFIPCFIEFTPEECTFLVLRSRAALIAFHKMGLNIRKQSENVNLPMKISITDLTLSKLDFIPKIILRNKLRLAYDGQKKLDLTAFCLQSDISHFIYYPLNNASNQFDLIQTQSAVSWDHLIELNLSMNRLKTLGGFDLVKYTPKLKHLDLSHNLLDGMSSTLLPLKGLHLRSLILEGNPLCIDYVDTQHYIGVAKLIFPSLVEIDGLYIPRKGELPKIRRNYCPEEAKDVIERFLEVFFPLLESEPEDRFAMEELYHEDATLSLTFSNKLRYNPVYRYFRNFFNRARVIGEDNNDCIEGAANIAKHFSRWPSLKHDPYTFYVDVLHHSDSTTIFRISGVLKLTSDSLADDEHLIYFTRSLVLRTNNGAQYRIHNEVLNWDETIPDCANKAFQVTTVKSKKVSLKLDSAPDEDLKEKFIAIFMKVTEIDRKKSERCLEMRNWDLRNALDYFIKLNSIAALDEALADTEV